jgi:hypothetical protein
VAGSFAMENFHQHSVFGQEHTHAIDFRHTSREDQAAHEQEIKMRKALKVKNSPSPRPSEESSFSAL